MNTHHMEYLLIEYANLGERKKELLSKMKEAEFFKQCTEDTLKIPKLDGMPHGNALINTVYNAVQKILDEHQIHIDYYRNQLRILNEIEIAMFNALKHLDKIEYDIISLRYIKGYDWCTIINKIPYSRSQCFIVRDKALEKLIQNYKE